MSDTTDLNGQTQQALDPQKVPGTSNWGKLGFIGFMLALTGLFVYLGYWQLGRLAQKEVLINAVEARVNDAPISLPPVAEWVGFDPETYDFRPLTVSGTFDYSQTVLVFTYLDEQKGAYSGTGYWVMAPLRLTGGGTVYVNRGFVPQDLASGFKQGAAGPVGEVTITGLGRVSEKTNAFTPGSDFKNRIEWVRNIDRLLQFANEDQGPVLPIYINAEAGETGALPQGGETRLKFENRHLEYVLTWFSLAALTPLLLVFWLWNGRRRPDGDDSTPPPL